MLFRSLPPHPAPDVARSLTIVRFKTGSYTVERPLRIGAVLAFAALPVSAEIIGVEQFDYPENTVLNTQTGGTFWDYKNTAPTSHTGTKSNWDYIGFGGPATISGGKLLTNNHGWVKREYNGNTETTGATR